MPFAQVSGLFGRVCFSLVCFSLVREVGMKHQAVFRIRVGYAQQSLLIGRFGHNTGERRILFPGAARGQINHGVVVAAARGDNFAGSLIKAQCHLETF